VGEISEGNEEILVVVIESVFNIEKRPAPTKIQNE